MKKIELTFEGDISILSLGPCNPDTTIKQYSKKLRRLIGFIDINHEQ